MMNNFYTVIYRCFERFVPLKRSQSGSRFPAWFTNDLNLIVQKKVSHKRYKQSNNEADYNTVRYAYNVNLLLKIVIAITYPTLKMLLTIILTSFGTLFAPNATRALFLKRCTLTLLRPIMEPTSRTSLLGTFRQFSTPNKASVMLIILLINLNLFLISVSVPLLLKKP